MKSHASLVSLPNTAKMLQTWFQAEDEELGSGITILPLSLGSRGLVTGDVHAQLFLQICVHAEHDGGEMVEVVEAVVDL